MKKPPSPMSTSLRLTTTFAASRPTVTSFVATGVQPASARERLTALTNVYSNVARSETSTPPQLKWMTAWGFQS